MTLELELVFTPRVSYVMYQNRMDAALAVTATNDGEKLENLTFHISSGPEFFPAMDLRVDSISPGETVDLRKHPSFKINLDHELISSLTERLESDVTLEALADGDCIASTSFRVTVLPFDDWPGCEMPETIASFVMPNAESLATVRASASDTLGSWGMSTSLEGYQGDRDRVLAIGAAVYAALQKANINYVNPPAGFESNGQRVRIPDDVLGNHEGTCVDLAVLFASALESIRINTLIFFVNGHAFAGFWLVDEWQSDMVSYDPSSITRLMRGKDMRAVECTAFTNSNRIDFEQACEMALRRLEDTENFICTVDIRRCRPGILPLPGRKCVDGRWVVERPEGEVSTSAPESLGAVYDDEPAPVRELTRIDRWKRDLLDITNRNNMINMKQGTKVTPLLLKEIGTFEDSLADGREFSILAKPQEWDGTPIYGARPFESELYVGNYAQMGSDDLSRGRIRTPLTDNELEKSMRSIYRLATKELEESGCNSLFIALGVLRWFEGRSTGVARYAPLILIPAEMRKRQTGYSVKKLDEDALFNVTLIEKLRQEYEIKIPLDELPTDDSGVDVDRVLQTVRRAISGREGWEVLQGAALGVFSFNQFVMWRDLEDNMDMLRENDVVRCLVDSLPYPSDSGDLDVSADPYGLCLTVPADGSQIRAVRAAGEGRTFIMHGPPGTGKSQTITNMICNALYNGKTVLFVAEKRAALEVVQKRLEEVGIGNHCLELHSNKSEKSKVLEQLKRSLDSCRACDTTKQKELHDSIRSMQSKLDGYVSELHRERPWGLSAFDAISRYEVHNVDGTREVTIPTSSVSSMRPGTDTAVENLVREAAESYRLVKDMDGTAVTSIGLDSAVASVREDLEESFETGEKAAKNLETAREVFAKFGLPVDPEDSQTADRFLSSIGSLDTRILSKPNLPALPAKLDSFRDGISSLSKYISSWKAMGLDVHTENLSDALRRIAEIEDLQNVFDDTDFDGASDLRSFLSDIRTYCNTLIRLKSDIITVSSQWTNGVYDLDAGWNVSRAWQEVGNAGFLGKGKARKEFMSRASGCLKDPGIKFDLLSSTVNIVSNISSDIRAVRDIPGRYSGEMAPRISAALDGLIRMSAAATDAIGVAGEFGLDIGSLSRIHSDVGRAREAMEHLHTCDESWIKASEATRAMLKTEADIRDITEYRSLREKLRPYMDRIFDWASWNSYSSKLSSSGYGGAIDLIREGMNTDLVVDSVYKSLYKTMINLCRQDSDSLRVFSADSFERLIAEFKRLDQTYTNLNRNLLKYRLFQNVPSNMDSSASGSEAYILFRAINSSRMRKSIRTLLSEIPNILPRVCPCLLMSPQSVAQYITPNYPKFDMVIFDESSQITTCKAVGALGRAKCAVIAGDSKQLPPTSFFQKKIESMDDDDDMVDVDSFLDDCLALNMPGTYLEWHYRSRHESLIAFSNREFYDNKMLTFPSPNDLDTKVGIRRVGGRYEKGTRCNTIEATAVVDEICRRVNDPSLSSHSIGVVAFSISQQSCIQDMLDDRMRNDPGLFQKLNSMPEELFIKNLETVQGDERDVILFSIGYGPDANGNVSQNFGPINRSGGGRRLNVAVSRARNEMIVFTSMSYNDVRLTSSSSDGVRSFRDFLRFAENGGRFSEVSEEARAGQASSVLRELALFLSDNGYDTHFGIGNSEFKVDVAVVDPRNQSEYILGILNDGESYRNSDNTRDREYARADVLRRLGWDIMHVWSLDWYFDRTRTERSVLSRLEELKSAKTSEPEEQSLEPEPVDKDYGLMDQPANVVTAIAGLSPAANGRREPYRPYEPEPLQIDSDYAVRYPGYVERIARPIIEAESPINEEHLIRLFCKSVNIKRLSSSKREYLESNLRSVFHPETVDGFITYWSPSMDRETFCSYRVADNPEDARDILRIPLVEISNAVLDTLHNSGSVPIDDAVPAIARTLGFNRCGTNVRDVIGRALNHCIDAGIIEQNNGRFIAP